MTRFRGTLGPTTPSVVTFALFGVMLVPGTASGLDASLDYRDDRQHATTPTTTFETYWRREAVSVREGLRLGSRLYLDGRFWATRETSGTDVGGANTETRTRIYQPDGALSFRADRLGLGVRGSWFQRRVEGFSSLAPETERVQWTSWLEANLTPSTLVSGSLTATTTTDKAADAPDREREDLTGFLRAMQSLGPVWQFEYGLSGTSTDLTVDQTHRAFLNHSFELRGSPRFDEDRLRMNVRARTLLENQSSEVPARTGAPVVRTPLFGGVALDDTPETLDPLEDDPTPVPELYNRDRTTPTVINLGDSAPPVREFGGDYRNVILDFGDTEEFESAFLYVDRTFPNPELYRWRVFVTDDPDGRLWEELAPGVVTVRWAELGALVQGWDVTLADGVSGRFFKMVNVKLGITVPDLFVTELEVLVNAVTGSDKRSRDAQDYRLEGNVDYDVTSKLLVGYDARFRLRRTDDERDTDDLGHTIRSSWTEGAWVYGGRVNLRKIDSEVGNDTDIRAYELYTTRRPVDRLGGTASWSRTDDRSSRRDQTTDTFALTGDYRAAPGLRFWAQATHGQRQDKQFDRQSKSWSMSERIDALPFPTLSFELARSDRWVDEELGSGFMRFAETSLEGVWSPVPFVTATADLRVQERDQTDWTTRESLSWTPFADTRFRPMLSADSFYDSRYDAWEPGARASVSWWLKSGLLAEGGIGIRHFEVAREESTPVDFNVHVYWSP